MKILAGIIFEWLEGYLFVYTYVQSYLNLVNVELGKQNSFRDRNSGWTNCSLVNENISTLDFDFEAELKKQKSKTGVNKLKNKCGTAI